MPTQTLKVNGARLEELHRLINDVTDDVGKDETVFDEEVDFGDVVVAIRVCAPSYPAEEPCWSEAVLFYKKDGILYEAVASDPCFDAVEGSWELEWEGVTYTVNVEAE